MIKPSPDLRPLLDALGGADDVRREAAIARLGIIGARAVDRLAAAYRTADSRTLKVSILRALEGAGDPRTIAVAREGLREGGEVACAAVSAVAPLLDAPDAATAAEALDALVAAALDRTLDRSGRLAAYQALQHLPGVAPRLAAALRDDPDPTLSAGAEDVPRERAAAEAVWQDALEGRLPDTPGWLRDALQVKAAAAPVLALQKLIDRVRVHEGGLPEGVVRDEWQAVRGSLHQVLALRSSRVAVYDLRETLQEARRPVPVSFLAALHVVGDESCLEPLAAAWERTPPSEARWRHQLAAALRAVARREHITRRHAAFKRLASRWPEAARELAG